MYVELKSDSIWLGLTKSPIDSSLLSSFLSDSVSGGLCVFHGNTREVTGDIRTSRLEYDCYPDMAISEMAVIADEAIASFEINRVALIHRLGVVPPGQSSVVVASSANHRDASFQATRFLIDQLKIRVPIWKKEYYSDGSSEWVGVE